MTWRYKLHGTGNRVIETRGGFGSQEEAEEAGERAKETFEMIQSLRYADPQASTPEELTVAAGIDTEI
jgi:hypothetical protein